MPVSFPVVRQPEGKARSVCPGVRTHPPRDIPRTDEVRSASGTDVTCGGKRTREFGPGGHAGAYPYRDRVPKSTWRVICRACAIACPVLAAAARQALGCACRYAAT